MQGNEKNRELIDQQFTDLAWSQMSAKLDREMPLVVQQHPPAKNRYGLFFLLLLVGFVAGIATMFVLQKGVAHPEENNAVLTNPSKVAETTPGSSQKEAMLSKAETDQLHVIHQLNSSIEQKIVTNIANSSAPKADQTNPSVYDQKVYNNSSSVVVFSQDAVNKIDAGSVNSIDQQVALLKKEKANIFFDDASSNAVQKEHLKSAENLVPAFEALDFLESQNTALLQFPEEDVQLDLVELPELPKLSYGFYLGTQTRDFKGMHGISGGLYASYRMDQRFSLRTGLGYSVLSGFQMESSGVADPLTPEFFEPIDVNLQDYSTVSSLSSNQDLPVQSLHYIDLPVLLSYSMSEKFNVMMGLKLSYLLRAKSDGYFSNHLNSRDAELLDQAMYNSMRKIDAGTVLGLRFNPIRRVGMELKYNHGLVDYTIDEKWHVRQLNTNKTFELSLNYLIR